jgi:hypothetical protein
VAARSAARLKRNAVTSNPFVVLSDITISLAIIFLVFGIATAVTNTQILIFFDRNDRQQKIENELVSALTEIMPQAQVVRVRSLGDDRDHVELRDKGSLAAVVWTNASFQRVQVFEQTFPPLGSEPTTFGRDFISAVSKVVMRHSPEFSYLFLHGIAETSESSKLPPGGAQSLSEDRARSAFNLIAKPTEATVLGIPRKYVIPYGTGNSLYLFKGAQAGRVDFLMFYSDTTDSGKPTPR